MLGLALACSASLAGHAAAHAAGGDLSPAPGLCLEAVATAFDANRLTRAVGDLEVAAGQQADFFPAVLAVSAPDRSPHLDPADASTVRIGVWGIDPGHTTPTEEARELLAGADCLADGNTWSSRVTRELLLAGAERILAAARLPDEHGEVLIPEGAHAEIDVEFHPADQQVRTTLEFEVDIGFGITIHGDCWIDDVLSIGDGRVVASSVSGMDVSPFGERACQKFERFMVAGGAGERAAELLQASVPLTGSGEVAFVTSSIEVSADTISVNGAIEQARP